MGIKRGAPHATLRPLPRQHPQAIPKHPAAQAVLNSPLWQHIHHPTPPQEEPVLTPEEKMAGLPLSSMSSSSSLVVVLPAASDTTQFSHEPLLQPQVLQTYCRALLSPWHLPRVECNKASSLESAPGDSGSCHPIAWLCTSPVTLFLGGSSSQLGPAHPESPSVTPGQATCSCRAGSGAKGPAATRTQLVGWEGGGIESSKPRAGMLKIPS